MMTEIKKKILERVAQRFDLLERLHALSIFSSIPEDYQKFFSN